MSSIDSPSLDHPMLDIAVEAARQAGRILFDNFRKQHQVQTKSLANFVSDVDLASERKIGEVIRHAYPEHGILGEEGVNSSANLTLHRWIVDPLDGTSNYLHGIPQFAVSIAYAHRDVVEVGVIYNPVSEDWFLGVLGQGAWYNRSRMRVNEENALSESLIAVGFYYDRDKMMEATLAAISDLFRQGIHGIRRFGAASLDLAQVARGDYGGFMEFHLHPWDHAAGGLLVNEAGGRLSDCRGQIMRLDEPCSILASNGKIHDTMLRIASPHFHAFKSSQ